jgi:hypothetical protein
MASEVDRSIEESWVGGLRVWVGGFGLGFGVDR